MGYCSSAMTYGQYGRRFIRVSRGLSLEAAHLLPGYGPWEEQRAGGVAAKLALEIVGQEMA